MSMTGRLRVLALLVSCLAACQSPPSVVPSSVPATTQPVSCQHRETPATPAGKGGSPVVVKIAGWLGDRILVVFPDSSCLFDPSTTNWIALDGDPVASGSSVVPTWSDGVTWAGAHDQTLVVGGAGPVHSASAPPKAVWLAQWGIWDGQLLRSISGAGYVIPLIEADVRLGDDGALTERPLPAGYVLVAALGEGGSALLRSTLDVTDPGALSRPFTLFLWDGAAPTPSAVAARVNEVSDSTTGLAWVAVDYAFHEIRADGSLGSSIGGWDPRVSTAVVAPDGSVIIRRPLDGSSMEIEDVATGTRVMVSEACGALWWHASDLACLVSPDPSVGGAWHLVTWERGRAVQVVALH